MLRAIQFGQSLNRKLIVFLSFFPKLTIALLCYGYIKKFRLFVLTKVEVRVPKIIQHGAVCWIQALCVQQNISRATKVSKLRISISQTQERLNIIRPVLYRFPEGFFGTYPILLSSEYIPDDIPCMIFIITVWQVYLSRSGIKHFPKSLV